MVLCSPTNNNSLPTRYQSSAGPGRSVLQSERSEAVGSNAHWPGMKNSSHEEVYETPVSKSSYLPVESHRTKDISVLSFGTFPFTITGVERNGGGGGREGVVKIALESC